MRLLFFILILAFAEGCSTSSRTASGFYLDYDGKPGHGVVGPLGSTALPLYDLKSRDYREQVSVSDCSFRPERLVSFGLSVVSVVSVVSVAAPGLSESCP